MENYEMPNIAYYARLGRLVDAWEETNIKLVPIKRDWFDEYIEKYQHRNNMMLIALYLKFKYLLRANNRIDINVRNRKMYVIAYLLQSKGLSYKDIIRIKDEQLAKIKKDLSAAVGTFIDTVKLKELEKKYPDVALFYSAISFFEKKSFHYFKKAIYILKGGYNVSE